MRARLARLTAVCVGVLALGSGSLAGSARADGDPASDVLASQALFLPQDAGVPSPQQARLVALVAAAQHEGYELRVALVASASDLGSVAELWHQPRSYARFLGQELALVYRGALLVIMPNGYGVYRLTGPLGAGQSALADLPPPGRELGTATLDAIQRLAAASGHHLALPSAAASSSSRSTDALPWIVFVIGSMLIVLAWIASLRARPLRLRGRGVASTRPR